VQFACILAQLTAWFFIVTEGYICNSKATYCVSKNFIFTRKGQVKRKAEQWKGCQNILFSLIRVLHFFNE